MKAKLESAYSFVLKYSKIIVCTAITYIFHVVDSIAANALLDWYSGAYSQSYSNTRRYQSIGVTEAGLEVYTYMYIGFTAHTASRCIWKI